MSYANRTRQPPRTLSDEEQKKLLKVSGEHRDGFRDHVIFSLALGTGLRESEIIGLDIGDVVPPDGKKLRRTIQLRVFKRAGAETANPADQRVHLPDGCYFKLEKYARQRIRAIEDGWSRVTSKSGPSWEYVSSRPLFPATRANQNQATRAARLSSRRLREIFHEWQRRAGFGYRYNFHALRHTALTNVQRRTGDIRITQRVARHTNIATTAIYTHPSDGEILGAVKGLRS